MPIRVKATIAALCAAALLAGGAGTAFAVGGPNEAGNSGKFPPELGPLRQRQQPPELLRAALGSRELVMVGLRRRTPQAALPSSGSPGPAR